ncbi:23S rRNA (uracil(1939)-C(5))-methyltransferase RlmD [Thermodesulfobacteriota bacterium]
MTLKKGQLIDLNITDIVFGGKGLARVNGLAVFVEQAIPLDVVTVRIIKKKKKYAEARIVELVKPSPYRIKPPCIYSGFCGGCKWQFLLYQRQLIYKRRHVIDALEHIGKIQDVPVQAAIPSARRFGYRNKMEFSCADRRWLLPDELGKAGDDPGFALGLHVPGTFYKVIDTKACLLQPELGNQILNDVREFIKKSDAPVYGLRSHIGFWRFLMLRHSVSNDQWMVNIITATEERSKVKPLADHLMKTYSQIVSVVNNITARKAGVAVGEYEISLAGLALIRDKIGPFQFEISANSFFQTNTRGAERLYQIVAAYAGLSGNETVLDLYSGTGTIAIYLAGSAKEVIGLEIIASAVKDAYNNCRLNGVSNCRFIQGDIKNSLSQITDRPEVMIIDPPRAGIHKDVIKQVIAMAPDRIVYVSCNPATMARDLSMIKDHYAVLEIQPVDMFPHTFHIESIARLEKR